MYGFKLGAGWSLPRFQSADQELVPRIEKVVRALPEDLHPVAVGTWFETPNSDRSIESSGQTLTPWDWLRSGNDPETVAELAMHL